MIGKIALWAGDKIVTRVLRRPKVSRAIREVLRQQQERGEQKKQSGWRLAGGPVDFRVAGKKGELRWAGAKVETAFRANKLVATDTSKMPGSATSVLLAVVGDRVATCAPGDGARAIGQPTSKFAVSAAGANALYPTAKPGQWIYYLVQFDEDCTWEAALHGSVCASEAPDDPLAEQRHTRPRRS